MSRNRGGGLLFFVIIVLIVAAFFFLRRGGTVTSLFGRRQQAPAIPLDLQALIPPGWDVQPDPQPTCDFDGDGAPERLLIYRYNPTTLPQAPGKEGATATFAPFGGVIYDTQAGTLEAQPDSPGPYRASNLVPYKLLPDYYPGKGQGYLGETAINVQYAPPLTGAPCSTQEINIYGFSGGALPTRLSVFRWAGTDAGYQVEHFAGDARVESSVAAEGQVERATTYNRLLNHRSILCEVSGNLRPDITLLKFIPDAAVQTIDFCFGAPAEPVYPEGVVVALLRGANPTGNEPPRFLLDGAVVAAGLEKLRDAARDPINIISVGNPSSVSPDLQRGAACNTDQIHTANKDALWCGRERVRIETRIKLDNVVHDAVWIVISVAPNRPNADLYWRVEEVELS